MPGFLAAVIVFGTSAAVLVLEILAGRLLAPYVGVTLETYTAIIGTVLAGIALGTWWGGWQADQREPRALLGPVIAIGGLLALASLPLVRVFGPALAGRDPGKLVLLALLAFFAPATVLSAVTPLVIKIQLDSLRETGRVVGRLSACGTAGALLGTFVTGFVLLAAFPTTPIVIAVGALLVAGGMALWTWLPRHDGPPPPPVMAASAALAALALFLGDPCQHETAYFCATVIADPQRASGRLLVLDRLRHSYVDLNDPTYLEFDYARAVVDVVDATFAPDRALDALHIGGGGFTLPRYLAATRPGTNSLVLELDPELVALARRDLGLRTGPKLQVRTGDARLEIKQIPDDSQDVVIGDAFGGLAVPWHLTTLEFLAEVQRVLRPDGVYVLNLIDHPPVAFARAETATLVKAFGQAAIVAPPERIQGRTGGNFVLVAGGLDVAAIAGQLQARGAPEQVIAGDRQERFVGEAPVLWDDYAPVDQLLETRPRSGSGDPPRPRRAL